MPSDELFQRAIDGAFVAHFAKLFEVLMVEPTDAGFERFVNGLTKTSKMYARIEEVIKSWEQ